MKYAVAIYGIGVDEMADRDDAGLTFGPALGENHAKISKPAHIPSEGKTNNKHAFRCVHNDSWTQIIYWNRVDPYVYEECIVNGCTKSVPLSKNTTTTILNSEIDASVETCLLYTSYLLRETKAPAKYKVNPTVYPVTVKKDGTVTIEGLEQIRLGGTAASLYNFKDDPVGGIVKITKVWKDNGCLLYTSYLWGEKKNQ